MSIVVMFDATGVLHPTNNKNDNINNNIINLFINKNVIINCHFFDI